MTPLKLALLALCALSLRAPGIEVPVPQQGLYAGKFQYYDLIQGVGFTISSIRPVKAVNNSSGFLIYCARVGDDTVHGKAEQFEIQLSVEDISGNAYALAKIRHVGDPDFLEGTWTMNKARTLITVTLNTDGTPPAPRNIPPKSQTRLTLRFVKPLPN